MRSVTTRESGWYSIPEASWNTGSPGQAKVKPGDDGKRKLFRRLPYAAGLFRRDPERAFEQEICTDLERYPRQCSDLFAKPLTLWWIMR